MINADSHCYSFLPYTINFDAKASSAGSATPQKQPDQDRPPHDDAKPSLLVSNALPETPEDPETPFGPILPLSSPALHFAKPNDPRTLTRADSQTPEWGRDPIFNQPRSKALRPPPSTILEYAKTQEQLAAKEIHRIQTHDPRAQPPPSGDLTPARTSSHEKNYTQSGWNVAPALHGNGALTNALQAASDVADIGQEIHHFGTLGFPTDSLSKQDRDEISDFLDSGYDSHTVFTKDSDFDGHYSHYCKTILWPVFNYQIPDHPKSKAYADHSWQYYVKVNDAFADEIIRSYKHGDTIMIHDYHLLLVPNMVRKQIPDARIAFFLHNAFPSSEIFRCLAMRKELLEGMLGANTVMFQVQEYAFHFKQTVSRILNVEATDEGVQLADRFVQVSAIPIGTVREKLYSARMEPEVSRWISTLLDKYKGKKIIASRDKLDSIRGVKQKLLAFEIFLEKNPEWRDKVVLVQVITSTTVEDKDLDAAVSDIVTRINAKFSTLAHSPIVFLRQDISFAQYLGLLTVADALLVTPLRDGMNLNCHDFIECQDGRSLDDKKFGPLVLSEFTGSSETFRGNELAVNPWDLPQMARAIKHALTMPVAEKERRYKALSDIVALHDGSRWPAQILKELNRAYEAHQLRDSLSVPRLPANVVVSKYQSSSKRLFILDFEGTLENSDVQSGRMATPSERTLETLQALIAASDDNIVYVGSQRTIKELEQTFKEVPDLGLIAENGCFVRPFARDEWLSLAGDLDVNKTEWKEGIMRQLKYYSERIEGSTIEERACSILFHYDEVDEKDAAAAERQAADMANHINEGCQTLRVKAVPLNKAVSVQPRDVSRVTACDWVFKDAQNPSARRSRSATVASSTTDDYFTGSPQQKHNATDEINYLSPINSHGVLSPPREPISENATPRAVQLPLSVDFLRKKGESQTDVGAIGSGTATFALPDFIMVAGDDREDEPVFMWANQRRAKNIAAIGKGEVKNVFSVCVGKRNTDAAYTLTQGASGELREETVYWPRH